MVGAGCWVLGAGCWVLGAVVGCWCGGGCWCCWALSWLAGKHFSLSDCQDCQAPANQLNAVYQLALPACRLAGPAAAVRAGQEAHRRAAGIEEMEAILMQRDQKTLHAPL
jgi:hypothetical protein